MHHTGVWDAMFFPASNRVLPEIRVVSRRGGARHGPLEVGGAAYRAGQARRLALGGYGYWLWLSFLWAASFIFVGSIVFKRMEDAYYSKVPIGLAYSFDMFLSLVKLRDEHYKIDVKSRTRYYLYVHKLAGWVPGIFMLVELTGLTK